MILLAAALLATAPIATLSETQLDEKLAETQKLPQFGERVDALSALFVGLPYTEHPLGEGGEGPEPQARWRLNGVDCQTFVETVMALANAKSTEQAKKVLDDIRYAKEPISFSTRNHFTEAQWLPSNFAKGYLDDEVPTIDGHAPTAELVLKRAQWSKVEGFQRLVPAEIPEGKFPIRYLSPGQLKKRAGSIETGSVILVVREANPKYVVRTSHMGFVLRGARGMFVRHATSGPDHRVVDEPFDAYLARMQGFRAWPVAGFGLVMPLDAKLRVAQLP